MSACMVFFGGVGQLAHKTALGVAAMCGNGGGELPEPPQTIFLPGTAPAARRLAFEPAALTFATPHESLQQMLPDNEPELVAIEQSAADPPKAKHKPRRAKVVAISDAVPDLPQAVTDIADDGQSNEAVQADLSQAQEALLARGGKTVSGGYIFFDCVSQLAHQTALGVVAAYSNRDDGPTEASEPSRSGDPAEPAMQTATAAEIAGDGEGKEVLQGDAGEWQEPVLSRGGLTLSGGYSSVEGPNAEIKIDRRNIGGLNREVHASARYSKVQTLFELGYADGNFLGSKASFSPTLFANRLSARGFGTGLLSTPFRQTARGINLYFNRKFEGGLSATANYRLSDDSFGMRGNNVVCDNSIFGSPICGALGKTTSSILSIAVTLDRRSVSANAIRGYKVRLTQDFAGLGGSTRYTRTRFGGEAHIGIADSWNLSLDAEGGYMVPIGNKTIPLFDRFYIGDNSLRGFDLRGIGPKVRPSAAEPGQNVAIGGRAYYAARAELSTPVRGFLGNFGLQTSVFVDVGSVFGVRNPGLLPGETLLGNSAKPRVAVGIGLSLKTPMGKLRLDFAEPVVKQAGDRTKLFSISFGAAF